MAISPNGQQQFSRQLVLTPRSSDQPCFDDHTVASSHSLHIYGIPGTCVIGPKRIQPMIGDDRIRLLDILPGGPDDPICARLFSVSLSESPAYEALSYTWGDLSRVKEIQVSHESSKKEGTSSSSTSIVPTWVTSNCYAALRRLRQGATDRSRTVWIYSICINQANIDEKNHQLTLMKRIYEKASCVIVYLGEHADDSDKAMNWIQEIDTPSGYASTSGDETELLDLNLDKSIMEALFRRPWFRRVWVLQEVWVAKKAVVYCGDRSVSWDSFRAFYHWNVSCHLIDELPYVVKSGPGRFPYLTFVEKLMHELRDTSNCEASDERDKLYAILPLIQQSNIEGDAEGNKAIKVDYHLSPTQVFINLGTYLVYALGPEVMTEVIGPSALSGLPSWVPDWSMKPRRKLFPGFGKWHHRVRTTEVQVSKARNTDGELLYELHGLGRQEGSIVFVGDKCDLQNDVFPLAPWQTMESVQEISRQEFWNSIRGMHEYVLDILEERVQAYHEEYEAIASPRAAQDVEVPMGDKQPSSNRQTTLVDFCMAGYIATALANMQSVFATCDGRRYFVTDTGLRGLAPEDSRVGDFVYRIEGAPRCPFIFRAHREESRCAGSQEQERITESKATRRFKLVGHCYVHWRMDVPDTVTERIVIR